MAGDTRPVPVPTPATRPFWDGAKAGELRLQRCGDCAEHVFYPRGGCPSCGSPRLEWTTASGRARLSSYVINHVPAPGFADEVPYVIAIVELDEGPRMVTNLVNVPPDPRALPLDLRLEVVFEPRGDQALPLFQPVREAGS
ncbi:Zn-ribbon domain-containing OB-fold protein [Actinomadura sp. WMMA1423]|uniref:Zn-ribbon domain-containing OB-fold protein n=1 Tax=Actinomadura sp. WMMA1423 TaxID=2591108 RepID=UPI001146855D|nr:OB-fold domain-containing protein [Actinomadura sp. WMMA1423]